LIWVSSNNRRLHRIRLGIESQIGLPIVCIWTVALQAMVGQDRSHLSIEIDLADGRTGQYRS
jgi:hypothetical protein